MASRWGPIAWCLAAVIFTAGRDGAREASAGSASPVEPVLPADPDAIARAVVQGEMIHVFDTSALPGPLRYVNDHTFVQDRTGAWHLFGIFHAEPIGDDTEIELVHAMTDEPEPSRWKEASFQLATAPWGIALKADRAIGETHLWAPHVVATDATRTRWVMIYQSGGADGDHAAMRIAESDDLHRWTRVGTVPVFEDICAARDPMLVRRDGMWALYYTRCESVAHRTSGVAYRASNDLFHWSEPRMVLTLPDTPPLSNSGFTESPFVFERGGYWYLSVSSYPIAWDATMVYRSPAPFAFPDAAFTRLRAHAAEWLSVDDHLFLSHAGPGQRGVWLSAVDDFP